MKALILLSLAAAVATSSPVWAQVTIRQYNQPAVPTPYPNAAGDNRAIYTPPPAQAQQTLKLAPPPVAQPLPPQILPYRVKR